MKILSLVLLAPLLAGRAGAFPLKFMGEELRVSGGEDRFKAERPRFRRDRAIDVLHVRLEIAPDLEKQSFEASVTHRFKVLATELDALELDAKQLEIKKVTDDKGKTLEHDVLPEKLVVHFPKPLAAGAEHSLRVEYAGAPRHMGLHFYKEDARYPGQPTMAWSQGEPEENSYWIPLYDYPNEQATTEVIATVPQGYAAVSNGRLVVQGGEPPAGMTRWHWLQDKPHVSYLIALYVARYAQVNFSAQVTEGGAEKMVPMTVWTYPGSEGRARDTFLKTPAMVTYFSDLLDIPYPWDKYDQIVTWEFFGGMENTSATNILDRALMDKRALPDVRNAIDGLIAHELAHQWFGDLITSKDWSHLWLNEAFATYMEHVWFDRDLGKDEAAWDMLTNARRYFGEAAEHKRPIVTDRYEAPWDMFDRHTYEKGSWVIHMLRRELGEDRFWRALKLYMRRHQHGVAETEDLRRAVEETTGKTMAEFFAQWLYGAGHPSLKLKASWDQDEKTLTFALTQKQAKDGQTFRFKLPVEIVGKGGRVETAEVTKAEQTFSWSLPARPKELRIDPKMALLAEYELEVPEDMLLESLKADPSVAGRARAAEALAKKPNPKVIRGLADCVGKDKFWGVASTCARSLGSIGGPAALAALSSSAKAGHVETRKAVAEALGKFLRQKEALDALRPLADEHSYVVQAAALGAIGALRLPEGRAVLEPKLQVESWNETIRRAALTGLGRLRDESLLPLLQEWAAPGKHPFARQGALTALGETGEGKEKARDFVAQIMETEDSRYIRRSAIDALTALGDPRAGDALSRVGARDPDPEMRKRALDAVSDIREGKKGKIEDLSKKLDGLTEKLAELEKKLEDSGKKKK